MADPAPGMAMEATAPLGAATNDPAQPAGDAAAGLAEKLAVAHGAPPKRPRGRPRKDGRPSGSPPSQRSHRKKPAPETVAVEPADAGATPGEPAGGDDLPVVPRVDPEILRPVFKAGYEFADRIVCGRIESALRHLGADHGLAAAWSKEAAVEPATLDAIANYGGQCLAQIFDALGIRGEHACWLGLVMFVGGDVKRKDNVLKKVAELAAMKSQANAAANGDVAGPQAN